MSRIITYAELIHLSESIVAFYSPARVTGINNYELTCPLCGGQHLHFQFSDRIDHFHCFGPHNCDKQELFRRLKLDGFDTDVVCVDPKAQPLKRSKGHRDALEQNIPAHDQTPYDWQHGKPLTGYENPPSLHRITHCYTYTDAQGRIIFYQLRADTNNINKHGKREKILKVYSSVHDTKTGQDTWEYTLLLNSKRPLYNLKELTDNPDKPVLLFEGEKTCEAAKLLFPDYVCVTYSMGVKAWKATDFTPLKGRSVTLWPDNEQSAIDTFLSLAELLDNPKIVFERPLTDRDEKWDVADELPMQAMDHRTLLARATQVTVERKISPEDEIAIAEKYNAHLRVLYINGHIEVYDNSVITPNDTWLPYRHLPIPQLPVIYTERIIGAGKKGQMIYAVDAWKDSAFKIISHGITYDPSTKDELVKDKYGNFETNKFLGWEHEPKECDPNLYACFINHIHNIMDKTSAKYFINYIAQLVQDPKNKPGVLPILVGKGNSGKTIIGAILQAMLGDRNILTTDGRTFLSRWSGQFSGKIGLFVNEFTTEGMSVDFLNTLLTDQRVTLEHKNRPLTSEISYHRAIGTTNETAFILSSDDRRMFPIEIHNPSIDSHNKYNPKNVAYFKPLKALILHDEALCGLHHYFSTYAQDMDVMIPPVTEFRAAKMLPVDPVHAIILNLCESGVLPDEFNKLLASHWGEGDPDRHPMYPAKVLRKDMTALIMNNKRKKYRGTETALTQGFMKFLPPEDKSAFIDQKFYVPGSDNLQWHKGRYFEIPPLPELRRRYNELVDPNMKWSDIGPTRPDVGLSPKLKIVPKDDDRIV